MQKILQILLHRKEEELACYLTAFYNISVTRTMIAQAIDHDQYRWLNFLWAFNKNKVTEEKKEG